MTIAQVSLEERIRGGALVAVIAYSAENWTVITIQTSAKCYRNFL